MPLVTTKEMFKKAVEGHYAVGAFNINNHDQLKAVLQAAENQKSPVILAFSSGALSFMGVEYIRSICDVAAKLYSIPFALHLDHGKSVELCKKCIDLGFTSVMIDASAYDFEENIKMTKEVVEYAHARGVVVESELGAIAGIEDDVHVEDGYGAFTHPDQAVEFVTRTGIDSLAIAIGTAHGAYKFKPGQKPVLVKTGLKAYMQENEYLMLCNRSSNPGKKGLILANSVGVVDKDYYGNVDNDGHIMFAFFNIKDEDITIKAYVDGEGEKYVGLQFVNGLLVGVSNL